MLIADLHIHSRYSRATSRDCTPQVLDQWARRKGISLVGTGDFTHPAWRAELREALTEAEDGLYRLREEHTVQDAAAQGAPPRFVITGEISTIYKKRDKVRKVHSLILLPGLEEAEALSHRLEAIGNLHSDGRPILGLDCRDLLEITLESCPQAIFIPAHIWTPHFSLFGAFSGFDTMEECFGDLTGHIHALETGLSSDPPMNWRLSALDGYQLVSNSDAHSPQKLGREATLLDIAPSYEGLARALNTGEGLAGTLEFFPEEGKYHLDGHRNCHTCLTPTETEALEGLCPVCGKRLTIGVLHRAEQLADRPEGFAPPNAKPFERLAPLPEVIAASVGESAAGVKVAARYESLLRTLGPEFYILREAPIEDVARAAGPCVAEGLRRLRAGQVSRRAGYDGEFGVIGLLDPGEREALMGQESLFARSDQKRAPSGGEQRSASRRTAAVEKSPPAAPAVPLSPGQQEAVTTPAPVALVTAGPGAGKTRVLVERIRYLTEQGAKPGEITAVTFTSRAAGELRQRLSAALGKRSAGRMHIGTFHALCLELAGPEDRRLAGEYETLEVAGQVVRALSLKQSPRQLLQEISRQKNGAAEDALPPAVFDAYGERLRTLGARDYDDLLLETLERWPQAPAKLQNRFTHLLVDEYQDCSPVQRAITQAWSKTGKSLFVIGDPDQAIYGFRGADGGCFDALRAACPKLSEFRLVENYRSTPEILACARTVLSGGPDDRALVAVRPSGAAVRLLTAESPGEESFFVSQEIARLVGGVDMLQAHQSPPSEEKPRGFSELAVLYRTRRQADALEKSLRREGIPYVVAGRDDWLASEPVRGTLCTLKLLVEPADLLALEGSLRLSWGCGEEIISHAVRLWGAAAGDLSQRCAALHLPFSELEPLARWRAALENLQDRAPGSKPWRLVEIWAGLVGAGGEAPLERLRNTAVFYGDLPAFLEAAASGREGDLLRSAGQHRDVGAVTLSTVHGAKGLEFPVVFLCGLRRGIFPLEQGDPEEERRLLYVGMTRARDELILFTGREESPLLEGLADRVVRGRAGGRGRTGEVQMTLF